MKSTEQTLFCANLTTVTDFCVKASGVHSKCQIHTFATSPLSINLRPLS